MSWHLHPAQLAAYASGNPMGARAASVEAHVIACRDCRSALAQAAPSDRLTAIWNEVEAQVDQPARTWVERLLIRGRVSVEEARLVACAPSLQVSWIASLALMLLFVAAASHSGERGALLFLVLAPLIPVIAVAGAYGRDIDPTYEVTRSTSFPTYRLLLLRAAAVLVVSLALTTLVSFVVADTWLAAAWLLPALAMVGVVLVLTRWLELVVAAGAVMAVYVVSVLVAWREGGSVQEMFETPTQVGALVVAVVCLLLLVLPTESRSALRRVP